MGNICKTCAHHVLTYICIWSFLHRICLPWMLAFGNGTTSKIDDVLAEHGGLLHVLSLNVNLNYFLTDN